MKRTQIYLGEEQDRKLAERARSTARTRSDLIREALDRYLDGDSEEARLSAFHEAVRVTAGAVPRLPKGDDYVESIRNGDRARDEALERHWQRP